MDIVDDWTGSLEIAEDGTGSFDIADDWTWSLGIKEGWLELKLTTVPYQFADVSA